MPAVAAAPTALKNAFLRDFAKRLKAEQNQVLAANSEDLAAAQKAGLAAALLDRLNLHNGGLEAMCASISAVADLPDPIGMIDQLVPRPAGFSVGRMRVPLGLIGFIYESRPSISADGASLCVKAGNTVVLRGGSEAQRSNRAIVACARAALSGVGLPADAVSAMLAEGHAEVSSLIADKRLDLLIPRGGRGLVEAVQAKAAATVLAHCAGNCHLYIDESADLAMAEKIAINAKTQRPGVCNALEKLLVHASVANAFLPAVAASLRAAEVSICGCPQSREILGSETCAPATAIDWDTEYLELKIAIKTVASFAEAVAHINRHGSAHSDAIVTGSHEQAMRFVREVDSSSVLINASTRFADGFEYGLGAEIGISTGKIHARGPVGLTGLTSEKWVVLGSGQIRT